MFTSGKLSTLSLLLVAGLLTPVAVASDDKAPAPAEHGAAPAAPAKSSRPQVKPVGLEGKPTPKADGKAERTPPPIPQLPRSTRTAPEGTQETKPVAKPAERADGPAKGADKDADRSEPAGEASQQGDSDFASAEAALKALKEGNARWVANTPQNPSTGMLRRKSTADEGQHPFVSIITCADSRIPVERVFDRGVGELFVVRVAGNVTNPGLTGTLEYGVGHLHTPLLVVMGHTKCGAVKATAETLASNGTLPPNIASLAASITPAVERARKQNPNADAAELVELSVRENVWQTIFDLYKTSPELVGMVEAKKLMVVGAVLDIRTGQVDWLGEHPWQDALVSAFAKPESKPAGGHDAQPTVVKGKPAAKSEPKGEPAQATVHDSHDEHR